MTYKKHENRANYNCGGYALSTYTWVNPAIPALHFPRGIHVPDFRKISLKMANNLCALCPNLTPISHIDQAKKNEYVVAFRSARDDFHFMVRKLNGQWYDKRGASPFINRHSAEYVFGDNWYDRYVGKIFLFVYVPVKRLP